MIVSICFIVAGIALGMLSLVVAATTGMEIEEFGQGNISGAPFAFGAMTIVFWIASECALLVGVLRLAGAM